MNTLPMIGLFAVIFIVYLVVTRVLNKAGNAVERSIRSGTAAKEDDLAKTVITFQTSVPLSAIRQAISQTVTVKSSVMYGRMRVISDTERGIAWEAGSVAIGEGYQAELSYLVNEAGVVGKYRITQVSKKGGVSELTKKMTQMRDEVVAAFKTADPNVKITTSQQEMNSKMDWF